jgi:hypothetical protein
MARVYSSADIETDDTAERDAARRPESGAKAARAPTATVVRAMVERIDRKESKAEICDKIPKTYCLRENILVQHPCTSKLPSLTRFIVFRSPFPGLALRTLRAFFL